MRLELMTLSRFWEVNIGNGTQRMRFNGRYHWKQLASEAYMCGKEQLHARTGCEKLFGADPARLCGYLLGLYVWAQRVSVWID